jgi:pregnancy-associated plasma protein-A
MRPSIVTLAFSFVLIVALVMGSAALTRTHPPSSETLMKGVSALPDRGTPETRTCGTLDVPEIVADQIQLSLDHFNSARGRGHVRQSGTISIPVYFHVINKGTGFENGDVPTRMLREQIDVLNAAYGGETGGAITPFRFVLVGVDRTTNPEWFVAQPASVAEREMKEALRIGDAGALNFYTNDVGSVSSIIGWGRFPSYYEEDPLMDGVVCFYLGLPGASVFPEFEGFVGIHEVGHWLGLYHTFQGGCSAKNDYVADTPAEKSPAFGCPVDRDTCHAEGLDPIENFMDYTGNPCAFKFTEGQSARMEALAAQYRGY